MGWTGLADLLWVSHLSLQPGSEDKGDAESQGSGVRMKRVVSQIRCLSFRRF